MKLKVVLFVQCLAVVTSYLPAQDQSVKPGINKPFIRPSVPEWVERFEKEDRDLYTRRKEVVEACELKPGMVVADIGSGTGLFTRLFSPIVGDAGKVYAVDIAREFVDHVQETSRKQNLKNIIGVHCKPDSVSLPPESIDVAFICDTYHHFEYPHKTMRSIHAALRPHGKVILIDFHRIEGQSTDWVMGHVRAGQEVFAKEITDAGFRVLDEKKDVLKDSYFVRFEKAPPVDQDAEQSRPSRRRFANRSASTQRIESRTYDFTEADKKMEYSLFVPTSYDTKGDNKLPLIVALHGLGSNPQQILRYPGFMDLAEKHGYLVVAPMGYNSRGWYGSRGPSSRRSEPENLGELSEKDVMNVLKIVRDEFRIDDRRIYLLGHSMGGGGTWHLAARFPELWAALAPLAPAPSRAGPTSIEKFKHIPVIVVQGDEDKLVPVESTRHWVEKLKELHVDHKYIEVEHGDHVNVAIEQLPQVFEFFAQHQRPNP